MCLMSNTSVYTSSSSPSRRYVTPTENDILCGRGRAAFEWTANKILRTLVFASLAKYKNCSRSEKTGVIRGMIATLTQDGGRFLKFDNVAQQWYDGGIIAAKTRVGSAMRDAATPDKVKYIGRLQAGIMEEGGSDEESDRETSSPTTSTGTGLGVDSVQQVAVVPNFASIVPFSESSDCHSLLRDNSWVGASLGRLKSAMDSERLNRRENQQARDALEGAGSNTRAVKQEQYSPAEQPQPIDAIASPDAQGGVAAVNAQDEALMRHIVMFNATQGGAQPSSLDPTSLNRRIAESNASRGILLASLRNSHSQKSTLMAESIDAAGLSTFHKSARWTRSLNDPGSATTTHGTVLPHSDEFMMQGEDEDENEASFITAMLERFGSNESLRSLHNSNVTCVTALGGTMASSGGGDPDVNDDNDDDDSLFTAVLDGIDSPEARSTSFESLRDFI